MDFRREVFECVACEPLRMGFTRASENQPFYKFPPTIGASGEAPLLFVGINPRMSQSNQWLHDLIMRDPDAFDDLARNRVNGAPYIAAAGGERHYRYHQRLVEGVFGEGSRFEEHAAATELFLCAKTSSSGLLRDTSPCADRYFGRTLRQVRPRVAIAVGKPVEDYFRGLTPNGGQTFDVTVSGVSATVIVVPHPNHHGPRLERWRNACRIAKTILFGTP